MGRVSFCHLVLLSVLFFSAGCGRDTDPLPIPQLEPPATASADGTQSQEDDTLEGELIRANISFITAGDSQFWKLAAAGALAAGNELNATVDVRLPAEGSADEQKTLERELRRAGASALAVAPVDPDEQVNWINGVFGMIEVLTFGIDAPKSKRIMHIGADDYAAGRSCAELLKQALPDGGTVALVIDDLNREKSRLRRQGVIDALVNRDRDLAFYQADSATWDEAAKPIKGDKFTVLGTVVDEGDDEVARSKTSKLIKKVTDLGGLVGLTDASVPVCLDVLKDAGKLGSVKVVGFSTDPQSLAAIADGHCDGVIAEDAFQYGFEAVTRLYWILGLRKGTIPENGYLTIPVQTVTKENVNDFEADLQQKLSATEQSPASDPGALHP